MSYDEDPPRGAPLWCVSFGDMMALLLGFFIMLYALSGSKKEKDFDLFAAAMQRRFGFTGDQNAWYPGPDREFGLRMGRPGGTPGGRTAEDKGTRPGGAEKAPTRIVVPTGSSAHLGLAIFFPDGSSIVPEDRQADLKAFAEEVRGKPQKIEIRGHATNRRPNEKTGLRDAWDLAYERSHATMRFLVQEAGIEPERIRLSAAGPNERFVAVTPTDAGAARSRVEVFLLEELMDSRESAPAAPTDWSKNESGKQ